MTSRDVHIDRLSLQVSGLDEDAARNVARLVALGLAADVVRIAPTAGLDHLSVSVKATDTRPEALAGRITDEIGRALHRGVIS